MTTMTTALALHLAAQTSRGASSPAPLLVARRHGGVLHVAVSKTTPSGRLLPRSARPVCGAATRRRLYVLADDPSPRAIGRHVNGQRLCHRCQARLARASEGSRAGWATHLIANAKTCRADGTSGYTAGGEAYVVLVDSRDVGTIAHADGRWHVHSAGDGVVVDKGLRVATREQAVTVLAIARELASLPGGPLEPIEGLTRFDRRILDFAGRTFSSNGRRDRAITAELGLTPLRFHQRLNALIDLHAAERYAPTTVHRRRRLRHHHRRRRTLATLAPTPMPEGVST